MAQTIANYSFASGQPLAFTPANRTTLADQTSSPAAVTLVVAATFFRVLILMKTYVPGNDTSGPVIDFNVADNSGMNTNKQTLWEWTAKLIASSTQAQVFFQDVLVAPVTSKGFWQIIITFQGSGTGSFDILVDAV